MLDYKLFVRQKMNLILLCLDLNFYCQRYGPPPSYPSLKIPGLNAPIPHGALFGYHPGGWGKPPVDDVCILPNI